MKVIGRKRLWKSHELAEFLGVSRDWVYSHRREIPQIRLSPRVIRYDPDSQEFADWLALYGINAPNKEDVDSACAAS